MSAEQFDGRYEKTRTVKKREQPDKRGPAMIGSLHEKHSMARLLECERAGNRELLLQALVQIALFPLFHCGGERERPVSEAFQ
jgi:hypothetical protein